MKFLNTNKIENAYKVQQLPTVSLGTKGVMMVVVVVGGVWDTG